MSCYINELIKSDQYERNGDEDQSVPTTSVLEVNDDNVAEPTVEKDDSFQATDKEIKYKTIELEANVSDSKIPTGMNSDIVIESEQSNELNVEELHIEKVDKTESQSNPSENQGNCSIMSTVKNDNDIQESTAAAPEKLIQDMSILNITEKNSKNFNSSVVLNKHTDSLRNLMLYDSNTDNESDNSDFEKDWQLHVLNNPDTGSSEDSESDSNESLGSSDGGSIIDMKKEL